MRSLAVKPSTTLWASYLDREKRRSTHPCTEPPHRREQRGSGERGRSNRKRVLASDQGAQGGHATQVHRGQRHHHNGVGDGAIDDPVYLVQPIAEDGDPDRNRERQIGAP